jgi:hypothetical protein
MDRGAGARSSSACRSTAGHELPVPAKDRSRRDDESRRTIPADQPRERGDHHPVEPTDARSWARPLQDRPLVSKDEDLRLALARVVIRSDPEHQRKDEVADGEEHRAMIQSR